MGPATSFFGWVVYWIATAGAAYLDEFGIEGGALHTVPIAMMSR